MPIFTVDQVYHIATAVSQAVQAAMVAPLPPADPDNVFSAFCNDADERKLMILRAEGEAVRAAIKELGITLPEVFADPQTC